jgi:formiminotetrahydrofolate cyclodeaminase
LANVEINLASLKDQTFAIEVRRRADAVKGLA